jgi:hypothetical protein
MLIRRLHLLKSSIDPRRGAHQMKYRCGGEGSTWIEDSSMQRTMGVLLMRTSRVRFIR